MSLLLDAVALATVALEENAVSTVLMIDDDITGVRRTVVRPGLPCPTWEADCAMDAAGATHAVLVVPVVEDAGELLHIITVDLEWGFDVHRCQIMRGDNGLITVGIVEHYSGQVQLHPMSPGYVLIQAMHAYLGANDDCAAS